jgi:hypothetical protein
MVADCHSPRLGPQAASTPLKEEENETVDRTPRQVQCVFSGERFCATFVGTRLKHARCAALRVLHVDSIRPDEGQDEAKLRLTKSLKST